MGELCFISGGARSGKSRLAERRVLERADRQGLPQAAYIATGVAMDEEFRQRIDQHRQQRDQRFVTIEAPLDLLAALERASQSSAIVLMECISTWLGNVFHEKPGAEREVFALQQIDSLLTWLESHPAVHLTVVSNEVGLGIVPADAPTRHSRDVHGRVNCRLAEAATEAWLLVAGLPLRLK